MFFKGLQLLIFKQLQTAYVQLSSSLCGQVLRKINKYACFYA